MQRKHKHSREVRAQLDGLLSKWKALLQEAANQGRGLEEAQDILEFNLQTDKVEAWIRDKELLVSAQDTGRDYEHCYSLQRRLDDVGSDMKMDDERLKSVSQLADKIVTQGGTQTSPIKQKKDQLIAKYFDQPINGVEILNKIFFIGGRDFKELSTSLGLVSVIL